MKNEILGIDFGSQNTVIYSSFTGDIIFNEPTCLVVDTFSREVKDIGFLASKIQGKTPYNFTMVYPVIEGAVSDIDFGYLFLSKAVEKQKLDKNFRGFSLVMSAPSKCTKVNRDAIIEIGKRMQAREIFLESQAKLAAIGSGVNVYSPNATLICNIGRGITDIACLSMGEIVSSTSTYIAGESFDDALRRYLVQEKHLAVGKKTAEYIKMRIGNLSLTSDAQLIEVKGRDTMTSLPSSTILSSSEIKECLLPLAKLLAFKITDVIATIDPELASDLTKNGLVLTGGGALLNGLKDYLQSLLGFPVRVSDDPANAVIHGMITYIEKIKK